MTNDVHLTHVRNKMRYLTITLFLSLMLLVPSSVSAIRVQHIGEVDIRDYNCQNTPESSFIDFICWARQPNHRPNLLASLNWNAYGWCGVPEHIITGWRSAYSKGKYFNAYVKGKYSCR